MTQRGMWFVVLLVCLAGAIAASLLSRKGTERVPLRVGNPVAGKVVKTDAEWRASLSDMAYRVTRLAGTERAFTGAYWNHHADGEYHCVCCGQPLFDSATKYESGTGWPSFWRAVDPDAVSLFEDRGAFSVRTEVACSRCDAHLGHVFEDGPPPTGQRFCMNSAALTFAPRKGEVPPP